MKLRKKWTWAGCRMSTRKRIAGPLWPAAGVADTTAEVGGEPERAEGGTRGPAHPRRIPGQPDLGWRDAGREGDRLQAGVAQQPEQLARREQVGEAVVQRPLAHHLADAGRVEEVPAVRHGDDHVPARADDASHLPDGLPA